MESNRCVFRFPVCVSGVQCHDWGVHQGASVRVYEGESGRISCPLFSFPTLYNYNQSSGLTLLWYRQTNTHELEQPIDLRTHTFLKHRDSLWIQPATVQDRGLYICMLRNTTSCAKVGVQLEVFVRDGVCDGTLHHNVTIPFQKYYTLRCPDLQHLPNISHNVTWYHKCSRDFASYFFERQIKGDEVMIYNLLIGMEGPYTCIVSYQNNGHALQFTRTINIKPVSPSCGTEHPRILNPASGQIYIVTLGEDVNLSCRAFLPCMENEEQQVWWSIDNKTVEELADPRYSSPTRSIELDDYGDQTVVKVLHVSEFLASDFKREFRCSARNSRGFNTSIATLQKDVYIPSVELGCGLGVTLAVAVLLFVLYRVYKLEVHLLYRSWFGTDERSDDKEYDVYISYARNGEEEEFVMTTLRRVLEVELGYSVCIFDRDSLPGGTITDETLRFVGRSRRLVIVVSALSAVRGTQALLELQAGLVMLRGGHLRVVLIQYKPVNKQCWVKELRRARVALTLIRWQGEKSLPLSSHFWKQLQLELPVRKHTTHSDTEHTVGHTDCAERKNESTALILDSLRKTDTRTPQKQSEQSSSTAV
ncbi:hypothetical protein MHYP_G00205620 [Metynnis hypsauchen]